MSMRPPIQSPEPPTWFVILCLIILASFLGWAGWLVTKVLLAVIS